MSNQNTYAYAPYQVYEGEKMPSLRAVLMRYLRHWPWFLVSVALLLGAGYTYMLYQVPVYQIQASLLIKDDKKGLNEESILKEMDIFAPKKVIENETEILKSFSLMNKVVGDLGLDVQYFRQTKTIREELYDQAPIRLIVEKGNPILYEDDLELTVVNPHRVSLNGVVLPVNQSVQTPFGRLRVFSRRNLHTTDEPLLIRVSPRAKAVENYQSSLTVEPSSKASTVLQLTLEDAVPRKGEAILTKLIEVYNDDAVTDKNLVATSTLNFIEDRLRLIAGELTTVEQGVESYKSSQGITDLSSQAQVFLETVKENDDRLNQTRIQLNAIHDIERYVESQREERGVAPSTLSVSDPMLISLVGKLNELELQRDQLSRTTTASNPMLQSLDSQLKIVRNSLNNNITSMKQTLQSTERSLASTNRVLESQIRSIPSKERALVSITRQQSIKNNLYTYLLEKREETALSTASTMADSRTIDSPRSGSEPVKPVKKIIFLLFGMLGLVLPVGVLAARDALNDRISRRSDVEDVSQVPILGEVVVSRNNDPLVMVSGKRSVIAEQIRTLRTNLQFLRSSPTESQVVLFTSSISGEGKSFLSLNLGASLALVGRPTVILEMDLRKPKLHTVLNTSNHAGLSNYLIQESTLDDVLQPVPGCPNYFIITSGPLPPNPSELLSSPRLNDLFTELRQRFDYVIVDSPPIGLVTDAQLIAAHADTTMFMIRNDHTPKTCMKMIDVLYKEHRFPRLNVVLNAVGEGQSYYYSYGYYEKEGRKSRKALNA